MGSIIFQDRIMKLMSAQSKTLKIFVLFGLYFLLLTAYPQFAEGNLPSPLFLETSTQVDPPKATDPSVIRSRVVDINFNNVIQADSLPNQGRPQGNPKILLNLFSDVQLTAVLDQIKKNSSGSLSWVGHILDEKFSSVSLVVNGDLLIGNIHRLGQSFQIRNIGGDNHVIREMDLSHLPPGGEPLSVRNIMGDVQPDFRPQVDDGSQVDVLVLYTADARNAAGGTASIEALIDLAETETNTSYSNSGINHVISIVHREEVVYNEGNNSFQTILEDLTPADSFGNGNIPVAQTLRDTHGADLVSLWIEGNGSICGLAWLMDSLGGFESFGYSIVAQDCATGNFSFGHELGHNSGLRHNRESDNLDGPFTYNHGLLDNANSFRTIMAIGANQRIQYYSNPDVNFNGNPTGIAITESDSAHNAMALNETVNDVANFRESVNNGGSNTVTGLWEGTGSDGSALTFSLVQSGTSFTGTGSTVFQNISGNFSISGTITGTSFSGTVTGTSSNCSALNLTVSGTFNATTMSGSLNGTECSGQADNITFNATKDDTGSTTLSIVSAPSGTPNPAESEQVVNLSVEAFDTGGGTITYAWDATCQTLGSNGVFNSKTVQNPIWTAPTNITGNQQSCTISITVTNTNTGSASDSFSQMVNAVEDETVFTSPPASNKSFLNPGEAVNLTSTATHSTNATLSYAWTSTCPNLSSNGSFGNASSPNTTWQAPSHNTGFTQACDLKLTVSATDTDDLVGTVSQFVKSSADGVFTREGFGFIVSPFWQADDSTYTFMSISHPSQSGMNSEIGLIINAVLNDNETLFGSTEFTIRSSSTQRVFIVGTNNPILNPTTLPDFKFVAGTTGGAHGQLLIKPKASNPEQLAGNASSPGRGYPDITQLNVWGAIVVQSTSTGFAMEFIGDNQDSRAVNTPNVSGTN